MLPCRDSREKKEKKKKEKTSKTKTWYPLRDFFPTLPTIILKKKKKKIHFERLSLHYCLSLILKISIFRIHTTRLPLAQENEVELDHIFFF
jgi:hypothetical protein